jgi:multicomponent Na+:H+ antiporter subunit B
MFAIIGLIPVVYGRNFLEHPFFEEVWGIKTKWGLEAIELTGVAPIVAGVVIGLFFLIAAGPNPPEEVTEDD